MLPKKVWIIFVFVLVGLFYWLQVRPSKIRAECDKIAWENSNHRFLDPYWGNYRDNIDQEEYNWKYTQCLHSKGLK